MVLRALLQLRGQDALYSRAFRSNRSTPGAHWAIAGRCAYQQDPTAFWKCMTNLRTIKEIIPRKTPGPKDGQTMRLSPG